MKSIRSRKFVAITAVLAGLMIPDVHALAKSTNIDRQLRIGVSKVRRAKTVPRRLDAAERLVKLTDQCDCSTVTDETIHSIVSLLDINDDGVQMWVAAALGDLGIRAKGAAPKLLKIYAVSACEVLDRGSPATIPLALAKMGVATPNPDCGLR